MYHFYLSNTIAFIFSIIQVTQVFHSTVHQEKQENASLRFGRKAVNVICRGQNIACQSLIPLMSYSYGEFCLLVSHQISSIFKYSETIQSRCITYNYILEYLKNPELTHSSFYQQMWWADYAFSKLLTPSHTFKTVCYRHLSVVNRKKSVITKRSRISELYWKLSTPV